MLFTASTAAYVIAAQNDIKVIVSGKEVVFADQQPVIQDGRTFIPIRGVFEMLDGAGWEYGRPLHSFMG